MRSFEIYGKWSVQASKQASKHTHARAQCSHVTLYIASVGLAQARPNHIHGLLCVGVIILSKAGLLLARKLL